MAAPQAMRFERVASEAVDDYWARCRELMAPAFNYRVSIYTVDDVYAPLKSAQMQLWVAHDGQEILGSVVTTVTRGSLGSLCEVICLGGSQLKSWVALFDQEITKFATENGCLAIEAITRRGFARYVPGCKPDGQIHVKLLGKNNV